MLCHGPGLPHGCGIVQLLIMVFLGKEKKSVIYRDLLSWK
jgi:hypothetical protein